MLRQVDPLDAAAGWTLWGDASGIHDAGVPGDWRAEFNAGSLNITAVPEPGTGTLLSVGLCAALWLARRRTVRLG